MTSERLYAVAFLIMVLLSACGGGGSDEAAYQRAAEQAVDEAVLTPDDLPPGWRESQLAGVYAGLELTGDCAQLNGRGAGFPGEVASSDSEPFAGPSDQELLNTVTAFGDTDAADEAVRLANDLVLECTGELEAALKTAVEQAAQERDVEGLISGIEAAVEPDSFAEFGDDTLAYSLHADFRALLVKFEVNGHIIVIRQGPLAGVLVYALLGELDAEVEESLASALARKLVEAEKLLAD